MKHVFIINPYAGKDNYKEDLYNKIKLYKDKLDCEIYVTKEARAGYKFVKDYCKTHTEEITFYACGGDGTINEVVSAAMGYKNVRVAIYPCGSGNDYVKVFGDKEKFLNLDNLIDGKELKVDVMKVNDKYAINVTNFGFDACVCDVANKIKRRKLIGGKHSYQTGIIVALFKGRRTKCTIKVDDEVLEHKVILLSTIANGKYVGGAYMCAPNSICNDGLLEVAVVKPISIFKFAKLLKPYKEGTHLQDSRFNKCLTYRRASRVIIDATKEIKMCLDGEIIKGTHFEINNLKEAMTLVVPRETNI